MNSPKVTFFDGTALVAPGVGSSVAAGSADGSAVVAVGVDEPLGFVLGKNCAVGVCDDDGMLVDMKLGALL